MIVTQWTHKSHLTSLFSSLQVFLQLIFSRLLDEIHRNSVSVCRDYPCPPKINFIALSYKYIAPNTTLTIHELRGRTRWVFQIEANSSNVVISARAPNSQNLGSMISDILVEGASYSATSCLSSKRLAKFQFSKVWYISHIFTWITSGH